ncbi:MAG TPA: hypothetical protein VM891_02710 [Amaricoccus sp.]|nr:hypothetical protein [Amaricoccus sp.]
MRPRAAAAALSVAACALGASLVGAPASAASKYNWDAIGVAFCQATLSGDMAAIRPLITDSLAQNIEAAAAAGNPAMPPSRVLFQTYVNVVPGCEVQTRNAALVEIRRSQPGGPAWSEYLVIVPEIDGGSRIDDVLFATRKSDTLRSRLAQYAGNG